MGGFVTAIKAIVGGDPIKGIADIIGTVHENPNARDQLEVQREQIQAARDQAMAQYAEQNVESARSMQQTVKSALPPLLALTVTIGFFGLLYMLAYRNIPAGSHDIIIAMVGILGTAWVEVVNFYFGSSQGSSDKNEILRQQLANGKK